MNYNPYELVKLAVNGTPIDGRPIQFDSEPVNQKTMKNAFGAFVKPTRVVTVCPDCGQGLIVELKLPDPPFPVVQHRCPHCKPAPPPPIDPFINPLESGRVPLAELDPLLHNPDKPLEAATGVVAERFPSDKLGEALPVPAAGQETELVPPAPAKPSTSSKKKEKRQQGHPREVPLPKAEGLEEEKDILPDSILDELDFDDSEMVE